ncbi:MAG: hypothetical protein GF330_06970 [Candidatus Eisenbacteria bacterium]|nr:hypothetical protein [Candidatus Eisenbacteria bacterium]
MATSLDSAPRSPLLDVRPLPLGPGTLLLALGVALLVAYLLPASPYVAALPVALAILLIPLVRLPHLAPALVLLLVPLVSGMPRGGWVPLLRPNELALAFVFGAYLLALLLGRKQRIETTFLDRAFLIFLLGRSVLPLVVHPLATVGDPSQLVKFFLAPLQYFLLYRLIQGTAHRRADLMLLIRVMLLGGVIVSLVGILQAARVPLVEDFLRTHYPSNKPIYTFLHSSRVTSLFAGGWNVCAFYLSQILLVAIAVHPFERPGLPRALVAGSAVLIALVMGLSFSFATTLTLLLALGYFAVQRRRLRSFLLRALPLVVLFAIVVALFFAGPLRERMGMQFRGTLIPVTLLTRVAFWAEFAWPAVRDSLLFGIGPSRFDWLTAESEYVFLVANCGLVGLAVFFGFIAYVWRRMRAVIRSLGPLTFEGTLAVLGLALFLQNLVASLSGHYFEYSGAAETLWAIWGMVLVGVRLRAERDGSERQRGRRPEAAGPGAADGPASGAPRV